MYLHVRNILSILFFPEKAKGSFAQLASPSYLVIYNLNIKEKEILHEIKSLA